ncbi:unnamed protein product [Cyprideis torosa]|uniref:Uncharacterized protein n=1 Tax=Cyprideis torosa TaxID=163714 RepID=A0A7R8WJT3_9CRUS|nr:unnamed protein product [Cyprideis torosa]CAG0900550.1 unnamed protein product [Cyprideis torosa]
MLSDKATLLGKVPIREDTRMQRSMEVSRGEFLRGSSFDNISVPRSLRYDEVVALTGCQLRRGSSSDEVPASTRSQHPQGPSSKKVKTWTSPSFDEVVASTISRFRQEDSIIFETKVPSRLK